MKTVLITGGARGIGKEIALKMSKSGWHVIINYQKSKAQAEEVAKLTGGVAICADIANKYDVEKMHETLVKSGIHIDCVVNNAGISSDALFTDISEEEWEKIFSVNVKGTYLVTKEFLPDMIKKNNGNIINISSIWGEIGASGEVCYSSSKAAIIGLTKALAKELAPSNIRVNAVAPGYISTDMTASYSHDEILDIVGQIPLSRTGTPEDVANAVEFLASDASSYMTGQVIGVNGGWNI